MRESCPRAHGHDSISLAHHHLHRSARRSAAGLAHPVLRPAVKGSALDVVVELERFLEGLRVAMYLNGCQTVSDFSSRPLILKGKLVEALRALDIDYKKVAGGN